MLVCVVVAAVVASGVASGASGVASEAVVPGADVVGAGKQTIRLQQPHEASWKILHLDLES